jgi:hypothetical protein
MAAPSGTKRKGEEADASASSSRPKTYQQSIAAKQPNVINQEIGKFLWGANSYQPRINYRNFIQWDEIDALRLTSKDWARTLPNAEEERIKHYVRSLNGVRQWALSHKDQQYTMSLTQRSMEIKDAIGVELPIWDKQFCSDPNRIEIRRKAWNRFLQQTYGWDEAEQKQREERFQTSFNNLYRSGTLLSHKNDSWFSSVGGAPPSYKQTMLEAMLNFNLNEKPRIIECGYLAISAALAYGEAAWIVVTWLCFLYTCCFYSYSYTCNESISGSLMREYNSLKLIYNTSTLDEILRVGGIEMVMLGCVDGMRKSEAKIAQGVTEDPNRPWPIQLKQDKQSSSNSSSSSGTQVKLTMSSQTQTVTIVPHQDAAVALAAYAVVNKLDASEMKQLEQRVWAIEANQAERTVTVTKKQKEDEKK